MCDGQPLVTRAEHFTELWIHTAPSHRRFCVGNAERQTSQTVSILSKYFLGPSRLVHFSPFQLSFFFLTENVFQSKCFISALSRTLPVDQLFSLFQQHLKKTSPLLPKKNQQTNKNKTNKLTLSLFAFT